MTELLIWLKVFAESDSQRGFAVCDAIGSSMVKQAPFPTPSEDALIEPPCRSMIPLHTKYNV